MTRKAWCRGAAQRMRVICLGSVVVVAMHSEALAQTFAEATHLVDVRAGSTLTRKVQDASQGGYQLSDGTPVSFSQWYSSNWTDIGVTWMTEISEFFGMYWGIRTGESGQKYRIEPGLTLGFVVRSELSRHSAVSLSATTVFGGMLRESSCSADFGAIGGVQTVNCRLAASVLPPAETLQYLFNEQPLGQSQVILRYQLEF